MSDVFISQKKHILFQLLVLLFSYFGAYAQDTKFIPDIEKIYLHTDRNIYFTGEDLWYKAYVVRASNNLLFDNSNILYVELISDEAKIIARNKTHLEMGLGNGDFQLQDSLGVKPGKYQIRAYTNWNRNFGDDFVFKKDIEIIDVFEAHDKPQIAQNSVKEVKNARKETSTQNSFKVEFFPEGGSLLENVASVVGFKAVDANGKPIAVKGEIYDSDNELITNFESEHDGMGKFQMLPLEGKKYFAKIKPPLREELKVELPHVFQQGYLISFRTIKGRNIVSITTNQATLSQNLNPVLTVICKANGNSYLETTQTLTETSLSFELPKDKIPDGISQITLFDETNKPQSERLVYFEKEQDLDVQLTTDKATYQPEEKVTLNVSSKSKLGEGKSASFSLGVTDTNGVDDENFDSNICSYFLMESDIRGKVYHPAYYFDTNNPKRLEHLDNLLLTQGWRDFVWKTLPQVDEKNVYKVEKGITISGRVKQLFADKPLVNNNVTLSLMGKKNHGIFSAVTDSIGRFQFENLEFSGKVNMCLNTRDEKGKFKGELLLDSIERSPMHVLWKRNQIAILEPTNLLAENVLKKFSAFGVKPENMLNEVVVQAKYPSHMVKLYGVPDYSYNLDKEDKESTNMLDVWDKVPSLFIGPGVLIQGEKGYPPLILIDGYPALPGELDMLSPSDVLKVDVIRGKLLHSLYILSGEGVNEDEDEKKIGGTISIVTTGKRGNKPKKDPFQSIKTELEGYYNTRTFYSPNPENPNSDLDRKSAFRNTIYWNPFVHPDKTGNATVNFYNSKVETKVKVNLEGITATGIPVVKTTYYMVKK